MLVSATSDRCSLNSDGVDLIIVLRDGSVAEQGSHEDLLQIEGGVYRNLWEAQLTESTASPIHPPE